MRFALAAVLAGAALLAAFVLLRSTGPDESGRVAAHDGDDGEHAVSSAPIYHPGLVDGFRRDGVRWVVLNSWFEDAFSPVPENLRFFPRSVAGYREFRERLASAADLVWGVEGIAERRLGPAISVYRLRDPGP